MNVIHDIREDQAIVNVTYKGQNFELPDPVAYDAESHVVKAWVAEAIRSGSIPGIAADADVDLTNFMAEPFDRPIVPVDGQATWNRWVVRPKTAYGHMILPGDDRVEAAAAEAAHEANRIYCAAIGDASQVPWKDAPEWQRKSAIDGVRVALGGATPEAQHQAWCEAKRRDGWVFGSIKNADAKTHPCLVPYADLPSEQKAKDALYLAVVRGMAGALAGWHSESR